MQKTQGRMAHTEEKKQVKETILSEAQTLDL